jgi:23S rRNA-/tRNA-specific pseudouridylate synthase
VKILCVQPLRGDIFPPFSPYDAPFLAFETENYRVFFKPAGMHSLPASETTRRAAIPGSFPDDQDAREEEGKDLLSWVKEEFPAQKGPFTAMKGGESPSHRRAEKEIGMLSRLDRATSGLIAFARSPEIFFHAQELQAAGRTNKRYWLLAQKLPQEEGLIGSRPRRLSWSAGDPLVSGREFSVESLFRSYGPGGYRVACIAFEPNLGGKRRTKKSTGPGLYRSDFFPAPALSNSDESSCSGLPDGLALEASITAGFRHQIRAHMAWCGHPIEGDPLYGPSSQGQAAAPTRGRLFLECHRLELESPGGGREIFELAGASG